MSTPRLPLSDAEDTVLVRDSARGLLQSHWPSSRAVALAADPAALGRLWQAAAVQG